MKSFKHWLPRLVVVLISIALLIHGPIAQWQHYHEFADQTSYFGIPHALDVLSNLPFLIVALWYLPQIWSAAASRCHPRYYGYVFFALSLFATSIGSTYYHLAPDDARLFWDRLPIALACAGLLSAVRAETVPWLNRLQVQRDLLLLIGVALFSVVWWKYTADLRPYLALQIFSLVLIPVWQAVYASPRRSRWSFRLAILFYVLAKILETFDAQVLQQLLVISGHSLKHIFAAAAAAVILRAALPKSD